MWSDRTLKSEIDNTGNFCFIEFRVASVIIFRLLILVILLFTTSLVDGNEGTRFTAGDNTLEVFVRDGCPHCTRAKIFLSGFAGTRPDLQIIYRSVDHDSTAREDLIRYSQKSGIWPPGVPTFVFDNRVLVGFDSPERTGPELVALVERRISSSENIETELFGTLSVSRLGLPLFTLIVGLLDGFNPCAMWILLFLLSMLVHLHDRKRMALVAGTFVLVSGAVYYAFMAAWLNVFLLIGMSTTIRIVLGGMALFIGMINIKDFMTSMKGLSLSIPDSAKPGIYSRMRTIVLTEKLLPSLVAVATLAVIVNFIELLCTAGFPAMYTSILTQQNLGSSAHYAYLGLYILGYVADDSLMVGTAVIALSSHKITEHTGRWLKLLSGVVMLVLGGIVIFQPQWLI